MKLKYMSIFILCLNTSNTWAKIGYIQDKDGFTNIRALPSVKAKIIGKVNNGDIISCDDSEDYLSKEERQSGFCIISTPNPNLRGYYIHKSRFFSLDKLNKVPLIKLNSLSALYKNKYVSLNIALEIFTPKKSDFSGCVTHSSGGTYSTNCSLYKGQFFYGTDNQLPIKFLHYQSISGSINQKKISIPKNQIDGLFFPAIKNIGAQYLQNLEVYYDNTNDKLFITGINSDGAGAYFLVLTVHKGKFEKKLAWDANL